MSCKSGSEWDGVPKGAHWCGLQFAVRYSWDLWIQIRRDVREFYSRYCLSLTPSVCVITASAAAVSSHTHAHAHTHALLPQCYQRGPGAGVCPCQKVTGAPIGNPKIKDPLFPLYVLIWSLCLAFWKLLIFGVHLLYSGIQFTLAAFCFACIIFIIIIVRFF